MQSLIQSNQHKYQAQEADAVAKALEQDPLAFDYDAFYDRKPEPTEKKQDQPKARP
jgi:hypothetical protein